MIIHYFEFFVLLLLIIIFGSCSGQSQSQSDKDAGYTELNYSVLVFTKTTGFRHASIDDGIEALLKLGQENGFSVAITEDSDSFASDELAAYDAVIFLNTTGTLFTAEQRIVLQEYIQSGGGFVGVHSATDTEYDWPWYGELVGAYFDNHPNNPNVREAVIDVADRDHQATRNLPERWERHDEWYNFKNFNENIRVLMKLDTDSYEGSDHPGNHPVAWYREFDGGRSFYTALGHTEESYKDSLFLNHLMGGILYAMRLENKDDLNQ